MPLGEEHCVANAGEKRNEGGQKLGPFFAGMMSLEMSLWLPQGVKWKSDAPVNLLESTFHQGVWDMFHTP